MAGEDTEDSSGGMNAWFKRMFEGMMPKFSFGGIFGMLMGTAIFAGIAYFVIRCFPGVKDMIPEKWRAGLNEMTRGMGFELFPGDTEKFLEGLEVGGTDPEKDARKFLKDQNVPDAIAQVIAKDTPVWRDFLGVVKKVNNNKLNGGVLFSSNTIFALMTQRQPLVHDLIMALPAPDPSKPMDETTKKVLAAVKGLVSSPTQFKTLLAPENFTITMEACAAFCPGVKLDPQALGKFVEAVGLDADRAPTPEFAKFVKDILSGDKDTVTKTLQTYMIGALVKQPQAVRDLLLSMSPNDIKDPTLQQLRKIAGDDKTFDAMVEMVKKLEGQEPGKTIAVINALASKNSQDALDVLKTDKVTADAVSTFAAKANKDVLPEDMGTAAVVIADPKGRAAVTAISDSGININEEMAKMKGQGNKFTADRIVNYLFDPANRDKWFKRGSDGKPVVNLLGKLGDTIDTLARDARKDPKRTEEAKLLTFASYVDNKKQYVNISALFALTSELAAANPKGEQRDRAIKIANAMLKLGSDAQGADPFKGIMPADIVGFFSNNANNDAFVHFLQHIDLNGLPLESKERHVLEALKGNWGNTKTGISAVLRDPGAVAEFLEGVRNPKENVFSKLGITLDTTNGFAIAAMKFAVGSGKLDDSIYNNRFAVANVMHAFDYSPAATPAATSAGTRAPVKPAVRPA